MLRKKFVTCALHKKYIVSIITVALNLDLIKIPLVGGFLYMSKMEIRKLQKTGGSTFLLSLPKDWIKRMGLKQGDLVAIIERGDGALLVDPRYSEKEKLKVASIDIDSTPNFSREITANFLYGYDIIRIRSKNGITAEQRESIKHSLQQLVGVEIVEESANEITLQCLLSPSAVSLRRTIKRTYLIAARMQEDAVTAIKDKNLNLAESVVVRDEDVDRLYFLMVRQLRSAIMEPRLAEKMGVSPIECLDYRVAVKSLESMADYSVKIAEQVHLLLDVNVPEKIIENILSINRIAHEMHSNAIEALVRKDSVLASKTIAMKAQRNQAVETAYKSLVGEPVEVSIPLSTVIDMLDRISECGVDIADLA